MPTGTRNDKTKAKNEKRLSKMKSSFTARIIDAMEDKPLEEDLRKSPEAVDEKLKTQAAAAKAKKKEDKLKKKGGTPPKPGTKKEHPNAKRRAKKAAHYGHKGVEIADELGGATLDTISGYMEYADGGKDRTWSMVGDKASKELWGDNSAQWAPIIGTVIKAIKGLIDLGQYVKQIVEFARDNKGSDLDGRTSTTKEEKFEILQSTLDLFMGGLDFVSSIMSTFTTFLGTLPIVGAVLGTISSCISFGANVYTMIKASRSVVRMKRQRQKAADAVAANDSGGKFSSQTTKKSLRHPRNGEKVNVVKHSNFGDADDVIHEDIDHVRKSKGTKKVDRAKRLDEKILQMKDSTIAKGAQGGDTEEAKKARKLVRGLEDYDVTRELTSANEKRVRASVTDLVIKDAVGIATSLASLDPTGLGSSIGASINAVISTGGLIKEAGTKVRQKARNHGWLGADRNKSDDQKAQRRHNLAVIMYDRMLKLKKKHSANLKTPSSEEAGFKAATAYEKMDHRITALGVAGPLFRAADGKNQAEMLQVMRKGFYREND